MIEFSGVKKENALMRPEIEAAISKVMDHGKFINGPEIEDLETALCKLTGSKYCIACSSGTDALLMSMMAIGVGPGKKVAIPTFNFVSAAETATLLGADIVWIDMDPFSFNLDTESLLNALRYNDIYAVVAVDIFGNPCEYEHISLMCKFFGARLISDGAQSFGSYANHEYSLISTTSFFPSKPLGCIGDGGAVFTDYEPLAEDLRQIRQHGWKVKYNYLRVGLNARMDTIQAAVLLAKLEGFEDRIKRRREIGKLYESLLGGVVMYQEHFSSSVYAQFTLVDDHVTINRIKDSATFPFTVFYPVPLHRTQAYCSETTPLSHADSLRLHTVSLPMHPYLSDEDVKKICDEVKNSI